MPEKAPQGDGCNAEPESGRMMCEDNVDVLSESMRAPSI